MDDRFVCCMPRQNNSQATVVPIRNHGLKLFLSAKFKTTIAFEHVLDTRYVSRSDHKPHFRQQTTDFREEGLLSLFKLRASMIIKTLFYFSTCVRSSLAVSLREGRVPHRA